MSPSAEQHNGTPYHTPKPGLCFKIYYITEYSFYEETGCWFVGGDDLAGALHDL